MLKKVKKIIINRSVTNAVRFLIDNFIPPIIRDNKYFMLPFFKLSYNGGKVKEYMEFKSKYYSLNNEELEKIYNNYQSIGTERETDLSNRCIRYIIKNISSDSKSLLDVACGRGYFLKCLNNSNLNLHGADVLDKVELENAKYTKANLENLPFEDNAFDTVVSSHTLEHIIDIRQAVKELKRVAKNQIIITVPCQRYFYYTLDLHLHFFQKKEMLINLIQVKNHTIKKIRGDWVYIGYLN